MKTELGRFEKGRNKVILNSLIITTYCRNSKSNIWDIIILIQGGIIVATVETYLTKSYHAIVRGRTSCNNSVCLGKTYFADCYLPWNLYHIYTWLLPFHHKDHTHLDDIAFYSSALWWFCLLCLPQMTDLWNRRKPFIALGIWKQFLNKLILKCYQNIVNYVLVVSLSSQVPWDSGQAVNIVM